MKAFRQEELALMASYECDCGLVHLIGQLQQALHFTEDKLAADTTADCIDKLCSLDDDEFKIVLGQIHVCELF